MTEQRLPDAQGRVFHLADRNAPYRALPDPDGRRRCLVDLNPPQAPVRTPSCSPQPKTVTCSPPLHVEFARAP